MNDRWDRKSEDQIRDEKDEGAEAIRKVVFRGRRIRI
jgi:hypothetical protein